MSDHEYVSQDATSSNERTPTPPTDYHAAQPVEQTDADNNLGIVISIWWSFTWRFTVISIVIGLVAGIILGIVSDSPESAQNLALISNFVIAIPISIWSLGSALSKHHRGFSVIFVKKDSHHD
ncbi:hypothetical protein CWE12_03005 [Aliidiomarina sedimenti]|uniref:Uncharacterized protein n=1 Tax=Aliidiomarina sedimenti TaxID=1933879 RepID=A0ABY0C2A1_9GAMM|nr:hypothetical protein [Aliidiomarina sedimenti]RUO31977.1 hypothetical protein CWE12_03005 [Aliidiomarina sedimenti]